jgi:hypothetical protein
MEWLDFNDIRTIPHPARSPDLNPIENIWWLFKQNLWHKVVIDKASFELSLHQAWD